MFKGVIHANARAILPDFIRVMPGRVVNICSGNFTLETTLRLNRYQGKLEGCDISLYTTSLGRALTKKPWRLAMKPGAPEEMQCFAQFCGDPVSQAAVIAVALDMTEHASQRNDFQKRMWGAMVRDIERLVKETKKRIEQKAALVKLDDFHALDGVEVIRSCSGQECLIMSSPPTYEGGYEKLYAKLEEWFDWDKPTYTDIGPRAGFAKLLVAAGTDWILFTEDRDEETEAIVGKPRAQAARGPNKNVYLYTNLKVACKLVRREVECSAEPPWPRLSDKDELTANGKVTFHRVTFKEANYFRQLYSSVIPMQASAQYCYVLAVDGKVFGQVMLSLASFDPLVRGQSIGGEYLYMMSDLPVASERYPRLSKLVLSVITSKEFQAELEHRSTQKVNWLFTTAFSHKPTSMKYRGSWEFHSRREPNEKGHYSINYVARLGERRVQSLYREWFEKQNAERKGANPPKKDDF